MFSGLTLNLRGDRPRPGRSLVRGAVEGIASRLGEFAEHRVEHGLAGPERILVAADADFGDARRHEHAPAATLLRFGKVRFQASGRDGRAGKGHHPSRKEPAA